MSALKAHALIKPNKTGLHLTTRFLAEHLKLDASDYVLLLFNQENSSITLQAFNPFATQEHNTAPVQKTEYAAYVNIGEGEEQGRATELA